ncbi:MAG: FISUMP domain-containing protein [Minisyncoccales bacterium]
MLSFVSAFSSEDPHYFVYGYGGTDVDAAKATTNYNTYGVLYNWEAAKTACPTGWHLPSRAEWLTLKQFYSTTSCISNSYNPQCSPAGTALSNGGISDFNALMGGYTTVTQKLFWSSIFVMAFLVWGVSLLFGQIIVLVLVHTLIILT